jgi:hypothetical protein
VATIMNAVTRIPGLHRAAALGGGVEPREMPLLAGPTQQQWHDARGRPRGWPFSAGRP